MSLRSGLRRSLNALLRSRRGTPSPGRILLYHYVTEGLDPIMNVPLELFRAHLGWLALSGLVCAAVGACVDRGFPAGVVGLSFDDGHVSVAGACEDVLGRGWSATIFVVPTWIDEDRSAVLGWSRLAELVRSGVEVGSHGLDHDPLVAADVDLMRRALLESRERIEQRLGTSVRGLAYPHGLAPARAREAASAAGFAYACTTEPGANRRRAALSLHRNEVFGTDRSAAALLGKLGGSDDWMGPVRSLENRWRSLRGMRPSSRQGEGAG